MLVCGIEIDSQKVRPSIMRNHDGLICSEQPRLQVLRARLNKLIIFRDETFDESIPRPISKVRNESNSSSRPPFNSEIDSESDKNNYGISQIEDSEVLFDDNEEESESSDQIESRIQPQNEENQSDSVHD